MVKGRSACLPVALLCTAMLWSTRPAQAQDETADWSGEWDTRWRDGGARLILEQNGEQVTGTYPLYDGQVRARATGRTLVGRWREPSGRSGEFFFLQARDGETFTGRFDSGEWWTGIRASVVPRMQIETDQSSPAATFRTFLRAKTRSVQE